MSFSTAVNCMDGRAQEPVINFMKKRFNCQWVDMITEPGPNLILAENENTPLTDSLFNRIDISVYKHLSNAIAVTGHYDCAGNPASETDQKNHLALAAEILRGKYQKTEIICLWLDENFQVHELTF